jgi:hypothetical protein
MADDYTTPPLNIGPPPAGAPAQPLPRLVQSNSTGQLVPSDPATAPNPAPDQNTVSQLRIDPPAKMHMRFDDGTEGDIPQAHVAAAVKDGGKITNHMYFDDGTEGWVPLDKVHAAIQDGGALGYRPVLPTPPSETIASNAKKIPNARIRNMTVDPTKEVHSAGGALLSGVQTGAELASIPAGLSALGEISEPIANAGGTVINAIRSQAAQHPWLARIAAMEAINQARRIPLVGKLVPQNSEFLPWLRSVATK